MVNNNFANIITTSLSSVEYTIASDSYDANDVVFTVPQGYKYLCTVPQNSDPIGNTAQIEVTVYRRDNGVFTYILHNRYVAQLSGSMTFINIFIKS